MVYLFVIISTFFQTAFNLISRWSLSKTKYEYAYTVLWQLSCAFLALLFVPFSNFNIHFTPYILSLFLISLIFWALCDAFIFSGYKFEEASVLSTILPFNYVITFLTSMFIFNAHASMLTVAGFFIIIFAASFISFYKTKLKPSKGVIFGFISSLFAGLALACNAAIANSFSISALMFFSFLLPAIINFFVFFRPKGEHFIYELKIQWKTIILNAIIIDLSYFFYIKSFQIGNIPQVVAIASTTTLLTAIGGIIFLKENKNIFIKILMAALATIGVILVQR